MKKLSVCILSLILIVCLSISFAACKAEAEDQSPIGTWIPIKEDSTEYVGRLVFYSDGTGVLYNVFGSASNPFVWEGNKLTSDITGYTEHFEIKDGVLTLTSDNNGLVQHFERKQ